MIKTTKERHSSISMDKTKTLEYTEYTQEGISCRNEHVSLKTLTPGLFTFQCAHRVIYGECTHIFIDLRDPKFAVNFYSVISNHLLWVKYIKITVDEPD